jgi:hypothetical protein
LACWIGSPLVSLESNQATSLAALPTNNFSVFRHPHS